MCQDKFTLYKKQDQKQFLKCHEFIILHYKTHVRNVTFTYKNFKKNRKTILLKLGTSNSM